MTLSRVAGLMAIYVCCFVCGAREDVRWELIPPRNASIPQGSLLGGYLDNNEWNYFLYVGRVFFYNNIIPAAVYSHDGRWQASFALDGTVRTGITGFEVAATDRSEFVRWVPAANGEVPQGAVQVGIAAGGSEVLYACRAYDDPQQGGVSVTVMAVGALRPTAKVCFTTIMGTLKKYPTYEVLVKS
ncbi:hypothetical protein ONE63_001030 [Megalurothrips usitatus]|uniref:Uncharacterized protein n=1 Tax=Megalurothrips usitatus TaxID=439358 RepID=A0AAV7XHN5_9NEOP|nr:hypothetical protein ONE63_001030 [Megalurothrips usitatus]